MKKLLFLFLAPLAFGLSGCLSNDSGEDEELGRSASDGAGYGGDTTFIRQSDPISRHQQTLRGDY